MLQRRKVLVGVGKVRVIEDEGRYPCAVCHKGVGSNSIKCNECDKWVHKKCSRVKGKLQLVERRLAAKYASSKREECRYRMH